MESTLNKEFNLQPKQLVQGLEFQELVKKEFKKISKTGDREDFYTNINNTMRFLIAREYKTPKALEMWKKWHDWRIQYKVDEITEASIFEELATGKAFWHGYDKEKRPCLVVKVKRHVRIPGVSSVEASIRFGVYLLEKGIKLAEESGQQKLVVIWDREGFQRKNFDSSMFKTMRELSGVLQDYYAERLHSLFILHPNFFFKTVYGMVKPFLNEKTKSKIKIVDKSSELFKYFTADNLLMEHGGTSPFLYRYPPDAKPITDGPSTNDDDDDDKIDPELLKMATQLNDEGFDLK